jgi:hypothetical protein
MPGMLVTCTCGKKLFFGDDPGEVQVCDRCGQKVRSAAAGGAEELAPGRATPSRPHAARGKTRAAPPTPPPAKFDSVRVYIASAQTSLARRFGCAALVLVVLAAPVVVDYVLRPPGPLPCGHEGKRAYLFGLIPGHRCARIEALEYLNRARREIARREKARIGTAMRLSELHSTTAVGPPPEDSPYEFRLNEDRSLLASPKESGSGHPYLVLEVDRSVRIRADAIPGNETPVSGMLEE